MQNPETRQLSCLSSRQNSACAAWWWAQMQLSAVSIQPITRVPCGITTHGDTGSIKISTQDRTGS